MNVSTQPTAVDLYVLLAPPLELIEHLERYEAKQQLPPPVVAYLARWRAVRTGAPLPHDEPGQRTPVGREAV